MRQPTDLLHRGAPLLLAVLVLMTGTVTTAVARGDLPGPDRAEPAEDVLPGEILVQFTTARGPADLDPTTRARVRSATPARGPDDLWMLRVPEAARARVTAALARNPHVVHAEPNTRLTTAVDPLVPLQWGLHNVVPAARGATARPDLDIDAPEAWALTTGQGVVVAVIDTGVQWDHPDLAANVWTNPAEATGRPDHDDDDNGYEDDVHGYDWVNGDGSVYDHPTGDAHGTHVAGTIAAADDGAGGVGVAPSAEFMVLKTLEESSGDILSAVEAIHYAVENGADVLNTSWTTTTDSRTLRGAIADSGLPLVAAAGNSGNDADLQPEYPAAFDLPNIISVTAVDPRGFLPGFANSGHTSVDVAAPGAGILSTIPDDDHATRSGTSMAAAHVAGVAALYLATTPAASPTELVQEVLDAVQSLPSLDGLIHTGGLANAANTLGADDIVIREGPRS